MDSTLALEYVDPEAGLVVCTLAAAMEADYEKVVRARKTGLLYSALSYRAFLRKILPKAKDVYLIAYAGAAPVGVLPTFVHFGSLGAVVNSLPFFGSTGGVVTVPEAPAATGIALMKALEHLSRSVRAVSTTIIGNPLEQCDAWYDLHSGATVHDERIGQFTPLPAEDFADGIMNACHSKTRNMVRKAQKSGFVVRHDGSEETFRTLHRIHSENLSAIGGVAKPWDIFSAIRETFVYDRDYRIYVAEADGSIAAAMLVFFYHRTAEYFTPAIEPAHRPQQPLSLLIFEAMQEACRRGALWWNWGGTWLSQDGVYHFKSRFGAKDFPYRYHVREYPEHGTFRISSAQDLLREYSYFYTLPFRTLESTQS